MALQPPRHPQVFVCGAVVDDQVQIEARGGLVVDSFEKADELLMPMPGHTAANNGAIEHGEGGKQRCGAMAFVVASLSGRPERQQRLGPVELALGSQFRDGL
jgi:hypothetical protein